LGISGGIIPCPDAIAILLVAVAINRIVLGLSLIVAFSLGLALVLTSIGIAIVRSRRLLEGLNVLDRVVPAIPVFSAVVVVGLGLGLTFNAVKNTRLLISPSSAAESNGLMTVNPDRSAATDKPLLRPVAPFQIDQANILYENIDENHSLQLAIVALATGSVTPLTQEPFGVWDYALSPDLTTIIYTTPREAGGSDIWAIQANGSHQRQLLACPDVACTRVAWSPDGQQLVYERRNNSPNAPIGPPSVWRLDPSTGDTGPIFQDNQLPSYDAQWSFDGQWLSYMAPGNLSVQVRNLADGRVRSVPSQTGGSVVWSPIGDVLLMTDVRFQDGQGYTHLLRLDLESGQLIDLTGDGTAGDSWASWSPQGEWVAVVRTEYGTSQISTGDQIWIMRSDGSEAHPVTDDSNVIHGLPIWSPDGNYLLIQQYSLMEASAQSELWLLNVETQERQKLTVVGSSPAWLY
ncbi:MAG TPA: hypothetical protein VMT24_00435, partial [Aggregatilineaceae bacterium]|nr:hypothetical protein [Aggregatilineaceae bacterium]